MRGFFEHWNRVEGFESPTNGTEDPLANSFAQGGERVVIPFGFNLYLREGNAAGHRLSVELYYTVHEDLLDRSRPWTGPWSFPGNPCCSRVAFLTQRIL
jgi:hypothetical protein